MKLKKLAACGIIGAMVASSFLACGSTSISEYVEEKIESSKSDDSESLEETTISLAEGTNLVYNLSNSNTDEKKETVYVFCDSNGSQKNVLVNEELKNGSQASQITDSTTLTDIENITGNEDYVKNSDGTITWNAKGADITYRGTTNQSMPVNMKITYYLDGKKVIPEDIEGKSGQIKIHFDFENNETSSINVNGKEESSYVPFTVITAVDLDNDNFSNISIDHGKISKTASGTMVIGLAMPGIKDDLNMSFNGQKLDLDIPESFEITADATDFKIDSMMAIMSSGISTDMDLDGADDLDIDSDINSLKDATNKLIDGSNQLYDGTTTLYDSIPALLDGTKDLDDGAGKLKDGAWKLYDGANKLNDGAATLKNSVNDELLPGVSALKSGSSELCYGIDLLASAMTNVNLPTNTVADLAEQKAIATVNAQLAANGTKLNDGTQVTYSNIDTKIAELQASRTYLISQIEATVSDGLTQSYTKGYTAGLAAGQTQTSSPTSVGRMSIPGNALLGLDADDYDDYDDGDLTDNNEEDYENPTELSEDTTDEPISTTPETVETPLSDPNTATVLNPDTDLSIEDNGVNTVESSEDAASQLDYYLNMIVTIDEGIAQLQNAKAQVAAAKQAAASTAETIAGFVSGDTDTDSIAKLVAGAHKLDAGLGSLKTGVEKLNSGASTLKDGTNSLKSGSSDLYKGTSDLKDGTSEFRTKSNDLADGAKELNDGARELSEGMTKYDEEGIEKLVNLVDGDAKDAVDKLKGVVNLGKDYNSFAGKTDDMNGSTVFIYKIDGIGQN